MTDEQEEMVTVPRHYLVALEALYGSTPQTATIVADSMKEHGATNDAMRVVALAAAQAALIKRSGAAEVSTEVEAYSFWNQADALVEREFKEIIEETNE